MSEEGGCIKLNFNLLRADSIKTSDFFAGRLSLEQYLRSVLFVLGKSLKFYYKDDFNGRLICQSKLNYASIYEVKHG